MAERPDGFDALPKRFRDYIAKLEARVRALRDTSTSDTETHVKLCSYEGKEAERYLPDKTRIEFTVLTAKGKHDKFRVYLAHNRGEDGLEVSCENNSIAIDPEVSNVVVLRGRRP